MYATMGSAPAVPRAFAMRSDVLIAKGRLPKSEDLKVVVLGGDGSTYDMALSSTPPEPMNRRLDFYYICYDNTKRTATPVCSCPRLLPMRGRRRHPVVCIILPRRFRRRKTSLRFGGRIGLRTFATVAHGIRWTWRKVCRPAAFTGPKCFSPSPACPTGWLYDPGTTPEVAASDVRASLRPGSGR